MSTIAVTVFPDAEKWLREFLPDIHTDRVACIYPTDRFNPDGLTPYEDSETGERYERDLAAHVKALQLLCEQVGNTLFVGGVKSALQLYNPGSWDVEVADAFFQLVCLGEVVYG